MATVIGIMGESGSGKTTSLRNLDPSTTYIIDCDGKGLSWRGWKKRYNHDSRNYYVTDDQQVVLACLKHINANKPDVNVVVIDTINGIMIADESRRRNEKGYDKWSDLAWAVWDILTYSLTMRDDLTVVLTAHSQTERDENGYNFTRIKTSGRKLDKMQIETKLRALLMTHCVDGEYVFSTGVGDSTSTCKTPPGLYKEQNIPNDIVRVIDDIREYDMDDEDGGDADD